MAFAPSERAASAPTVRPSIVVMVKMVDLICVESGVVLQCFENRFDNEVVGKEGEAKGLNRQQRSLTLDRGS